MSLVPRRGSPAAWRLFETGFRPWLRRRIGAIHLAGLPDRPPPPDLPILVAANHMSWFDGFLVREVQRVLRPKGVHRTIMLERELSRSSTLRFLGGVGFDPGRPQTLRGALREISALREVEEGLFVAFFPQGRIRPAWSEPLDFRPGLRLVARALAPCLVLPLAMHLEPGHSIAPQAWLLADEPVAVSGGESLDPAGVERAVEGAARTIRAHLELHEEGAAQAWPPSSPS